LAPFGAGLGFRVFYSMEADQEQRKTDENRQKRRKKHETAVKKDYLVEKYRKKKHINTE